MLTKTIPTKVFKRVKTSYESKGFIVTSIGYVVVNHKHFTIIRVALPKQTIRQQFIEWVKRTF